MESKDGGSAGGDASLHALTAEDVIRGSLTAWWSGASEEELLRFRVVEN